MNIISLAMCGSRAHAEAMREHLTRAGVPAEVHEEMGLRRFWFTSQPGGGPRVKVPAGDYVQASRLVLDRDAADGAPQGVIRCPECRSLRVMYPQFARHSLLTNLMLGLAAGMGLVEKDYYCEECHFTWPRKGGRPRRNRAYMAPYYFIEGVEQTPAVERASQPDAPRKAA